MIETWEDVFRKQGFMVGEFVCAVANGQPMVPNFGDGVQQIFICDPDGYMLELFVWEGR